MSTLSGLSLEQIQAISDRLLGTCDSPEGMDEVAEVNLEGIDVDSLLADLAGNTGIGQCEGCGWWFNISELSEDLLCADCEETDERE